MTQVLAAPLIGLVIFAVPFFLIVVVVLKGKGR